MLILGLQRGDLDWREMIRPQALSALISPAMTREEYRGAMPQRGRPRLQASCIKHPGKDTRRAKRRRRLPA